MYSARTAPNVRRRPKTLRPNHYEPHNIRTGKVNFARPLRGSKDSWFGLRWPATLFWVSVRAPCPCPEQTPLFCLTRWVLQCSLVACLSDIGFHFVWFALPVRGPSRIRYLQSPGRPMIWIEAWKPGKTNLVGQSRIENRKSRWP